jgi:hypothetical protein
LKSSQTGLFPESPDISSKRVDGDQLETITDRFISNISVEETLTEETATERSVKDNWNKEVKLRSSNPEIPVRMTIPCFIAKYKNLARNVNLNDELISLVGTITRKRDACEGTIFFYDLFGDSAIIQIMSNVSSYDGGYLLSANAFKDIHHAIIVGEAFEVIGCPGMSSTAVLSILAKKIVPFSAPEYQSKTEILHQPRSRLKKEESYEPRRSRVPPQTEAKVPLFEDLCRFCRYLKKNPKCKNYSHIDGQPFKISPFSINAASFSRVDDNYGDQDPRESSRRSDATASRYDRAVTKETKSKANVC